MSSSSPNRLARLEHLRLADRQRPVNAFGLRTLLLMVTGFCVLLAMGVAVWPLVAPRLSQKLEVTSQWLPNAPLTESLLPVAVLFNLGCGFLLAYAVYRLRGRLGFVLLGTTCAVSLIGLFAALALDVQPLQQTRMQDASLAQALFLLLVIGGCIFPLASFAGWYASNVLKSSK